MYRHATGVREWEIYSVIAGSEAARDIIFF